MKIIIEEILTEIKHTSTCSVKDAVKKQIERLSLLIHEQVNKIIHHEEFKHLECSWRGLHYLVIQSKANKTLNIKVLNISKKELYKHLIRYKGISWDHSLIFKKLHDDIYGGYLEEPFGCLVANYYFSDTPSDVFLLQEISKIAEAIHVPFITASAPE